MNGCICNVKEGEEKLISVGDWVNLYIELICGEYWISGVADGNAIMKINYCPICGRKLEKEIVYEDYSEYLE
jgi:hypothetical protein